MGRTTFCMTIAAIAALAAATPALADVKTGVDAWAAGDFAGAVRQWQGPADAGDADAQFNLGQAYKLGRGVRQDLARAEELFGRAAAQGHIQASDNYGLLLFQRGERARALPYLAAASDRGDPRAQYLLGIAHFNGDIVAKDWVRAYALTSLARQSGLAQAASAMQQMDQFIPIEQRQQGTALAAELAEQAQATRARQLAAVDLGSQAPAAAAPPPVAAIRTPRAPTPIPRDPIPAPGAAVAAATRVAGTDSPQTAGADYARPVITTAMRPAAPRPAAANPVAQRPVQPAVRPAPVPAAYAASAGGEWRVQLGAFGVAANADALWNRVRGRPELAGHPRLMVRAGAVSKLQAGGYASQAEAQAACSRLSAAGFTCIAVRN